MSQRRVIIPCCSRARTASRSARAASSQRCVSDRWTASYSRLFGLRTGKSRPSHAAGMRVVLASRHLPDAEVDMVLVDSVRGARIAVEHLIAHGHERIAYVGGPKALRNFRIVCVDGARLSARPSFRRRMKSVSTQTNWTSMPEPRRRVGFWLCLNRLRPSSRRQTISHSAFSRPATKLAVRSRSASLWRASTTCPLARSR